MSRSPEAEPSSGRSGHGGPLRVVNRSPSAASMSAPVEEATVELEEASEIVTTLVASLDGEGLDLSFELERLNLL